MKFTSVIYKPALSLVAALALSIQLRAQSQPRYAITDLGPPDNPFSQATWLNDYGVVTGVETASDGSQNAVAWYWGARIDIGKPGLGGPNSTAGGVNQLGQIVGAAETAANSEEIVGFGATEDGDLHAFLATPCREHSGTCNGDSAPIAKRNVTLSERARTMLLQCWLRQH